MQTESLSAPVDVKKPVERGLFLTPGTKIVHACRVRDDIGAGMTRCGIPFLIGSQHYCEDSVFGAPPKEGSDGSWRLCKGCLRNANYDQFASKWKNHTDAVKKTLRLVITRAKARLGKTQ